MRLPYTMLAVATCVLSTVSAWAQERDLINRQQGQKSILGALVQATGASSDYQGVVIRRVQANSAAEVGGLQAGDILIRLQGTTIKSPNDLVTALSTYEPGQRVYFRLIRDGTPRTVAVTLRGQGSSQADELEGRAANAERRDRSGSQDDSVFTESWLDQHASRTDARWKRDNPFQFGPDGDPRVRPEQPASQVFLGVTVESTGDDSNYNGVIIRNVQPDSPAQRAGLRIDDILIRAGNTKITEPQDLTHALSYFRPGDTLTFAVVRDDRRRNITLTLQGPPGTGSKQEDSRQATSPGRRGLNQGLSREDGFRVEREFPVGKSDDQGTRIGSRMDNRRPDRPSVRNSAAESSAFLGLRIRNLTDKMKKELKTAEGGILVAEVVSGSPAEQAGLRAGDVVTAIDGHEISNGSDASQAIRLSGGPGTKLRFTVEREQEAKELTATLGMSPADLMVIFSLPESDEETARRHSYSKPAVPPFHSSPTRPNKQPKRY